MKFIEKVVIRNKLSAFKKWMWTLLVLIFVFSSTISAQKDIPDDFCISTEEQQLFDRINILLEEYGKSPLETSVSLFYVAHLHVDDLINNHPDTSICNLSSWSDKGEWTACCHNPFVPQQDCMWDKPDELTRYKYRGYELAAYFEDEFNVDSVIRLWSNSKQVLDMLLTAGNFEKKKWVCMGVGMNEHYVSLWFGQRPDKANETMLCKTNDMQGVAITGSSPGEPVTYYLVAASFGDLKDAKEALRRFKKTGFKNASILSEGQNHRVYLDQFNDLKEAMYEKKQLPYTYRDAWVFKK